MLRLETNSSIKLKKEKLGMLTLCGISLRKALSQLRTKRVRGRKEQERREKHIGGTTKLHRPLKKKTPVSVSSSVGLGGGQGGLTRGAGRGGLLHGRGRRSLGGLGICL